jgi:hypothetical protein
LLDPVEQEDVPQFFAVVDRDADDLAAALGGAADLGSGAADLLDLAVGGDVAGAGEAFVKFLAGRAAG